MHAFSQITNQLRPSEECQNTREKWTAQIKVCLQIKKNPECSRERKPHNLSNSGNKWSHTVHPGRRLERSWLSYTDLGKDNKVRFFTFKYSLSFEKFKRFPLLPNKIIDELSFIDALSFIKKLVKQVWRDSCKGKTALISELVDNLMDIRAVRFFSRR